MQPKTQMLLLGKCYAIKSDSDFVRDAILGKPDPRPEEVRGDTNGAIARALFVLGRIRSHLDDLEKELRLLQQEDERNAA